MEQVYAKLKRLRLSPLRRVVSGEKLFDADAATVTDCVDYSPDIKLEDNQWFRISSFSEQNYFPDFLRDPLESSDIADLTRGQFEQISYLLAVQDDTYCFQRVKPSSTLRRTILTIGDVTTIETPRDRIVVNTFPDAIFSPSSDELYFRDLAGVSPMFKDIDLLFKEATDDQVEAFLSQSFISLDDFRLDNVSKPNRKRIALTQATLEAFSSKDMDSIVDYIKAYTDGELTYLDDSAAFAITSDNDLRTLLYGIEQRFYTTEIGSERRLANSVIRI